MIQLFLLLCEFNLIWEQIWRNWENICSFFVILIVGFLEHFGHCGLLGMDLWIIFPPMVERSVDIDVNKIIPKFDQSWHGGNGGYLFISI